MRLSDRISPRMVNVRAYGAVGDGSTNDTQAILNAIDAARAISNGMSRQSVTVYFPHGSYYCTSTLEIPSGVAIWTDGRIMNYLSDKWKPTVWLKPGSGAVKLNIWGNYGSGCLVGQESELCDVWLMSARFWNCGEEYDPQKGSKYGMRISGYNFDLGQIQIDGGNIGLDIKGASDIRLATALIWSPSTGVRITDGSEHVHIGHVMVDTPSYIAAQIDSSHDLDINIATFINNQQQSSGLTNAIIVGQYSSSDKVNSLRLDATVQNTGGTALSLSNCREVLINLVASNGPLGTGNTTPISTAIAYGSGVESTTKIVLVKSSDINTYSGTQSGTIL